MAELMHADIFFFITSVVTIVLGLCGLVALYYIVLILRDVRMVTKRIREAAEEVEEDFEDLRASVRAQGVRVRTIVELVLGFIARKIPKEQSKRKSKRAVSLDTDQLTDN